MDNFIEYRDIMSIEINKSIAFDHIVGTFNKNIYKVVLNDNPKYYDKQGTEIPFFIFGTFYISDVIIDKDKETVTFNCNDLTYKFDELYDKKCCTFPCTVKEWLQAICVNRNVELGTIYFPNMDTILSEQPYLDVKATFRNAVQVIAGSSNSWACIENDKLVLKWFEADEEPIDVIDWLSLDQKEETKSINIVVLGRGDAEDNVKYPTVTPDNPIEWRIDNNSILDLDREHLIIPIFDRVKDFKYIPFKMETFGMDIKLGQKIKYKDKYGSTYQTFVMTNNLIFNGGNPNDLNCYTSKLESIELKENKTKYDYAGTIESRLTKAEINVKKQQGEIELLVEEVKQSGIPRYQEPPAEAKEEDIYLNTTDNIIYVYKNGKWVATSIDPSSLEDYWTKEDTKAEIDINANEIKLDVSQSKEDIEGLKEQSNELTAKIDGLTNTQTTKGGINLFHNALGFFKDEYWQNAGGSFSNTEIKNETGEQNAWLLKNGNQNQTIEVKNGMYTISFMYKKLIELSICKIKINNTEYFLDSMSWKEFSQTFEVKEHSIKFEMISDTNNSCYLGILMCNSGEIKIPYSNNPNETVTETVKIGQGIEITSSKTNTKQTQNSDGNRIINISTNETVTEFTDKGTRTKELIVENQARVTGLLFQKVSDQTWISRM